MNRNTERMETHVVKKNKQIIEDQCYKIKHEIASLKQTTNTAIYKTQNKNTNETNHRLCIDI